ncbi:hypothetical protein LAZ67_18002390 [Cordylochernes scorpioides]|uniref:Uncharacterized protein n=1 Tax=Cordylochernes scorpioides TaxID=51811 RepID=A0ABY6LGK0_9ARAC|nr:hypothetical protein LAZ67_18002390 [Cordylochernes scorpioides]
MQPGPHRLVGRSDVSLSWHRLVGSSPRSETSRRVFSLPQMSPDSVLPHTGILFLAPATWQRGLPPLFPQLYYGILALSFTLQYIQRVTTLHDYHELSHYITGRLHQSVVVAVEGCGGTCQNGGSCVQDGSPRCVCRGPYTEFPVHGYRSSSGLTTPYYRAVPYLYCFSHPPYRTTLYNGVVAGARCERYTLKIPYKPLSQRMLEEPFWLGLITVCSVLVVILCVYCIKRKFADKIEKLLAEEIERSKYNRTSSATRYSLTSTVTPGSPSPQTSLFSRLRGKPASGLSPASRSGFEELLRRVARRPAGPREGEEARGDDEKLRILSNLVSSSPRRMSLDEFFRLNEKRLQQESSGEGEQETSLSSKLSPRFCRHSAPSFTDFASIGEQPYREAVSSSSSSASSPSHRVEEQVRAEITPPPPSQSPPPSTHRAPEVKIFKVPSQESDGNIYDSYPDLQPDSNDSMFLRVPNALAPPLRGSLMERSNSLTVPPMFEESASCSIIIQAEHEFHPPVRKYSVDLPMPKILITSNVDDPCTPQTPNPSKHIEYLSPYISNDRTISESNLSTSGYSSLSSPGLSRCNSGSPVTLEEHSKSCPPSAFLFPPTPVACELSPQRTRHLLASKHRRSGHHHHPPIKKTSSYQTTSTEESIEDESLDPAEIRRRQQQGLLVGTRAEVEPFVCYPDKTSPKSKGACRKHAGARRSPTEHLSPDHHKSSESDEDPESSRGGKPRKPRVRSHDSAESVKSPGGSPRPLASPPFPKYRNKPPGAVPYLYCFSHPPHKTTLYNGVVAGARCEKYALKIPYKPLSQRMLEEPFWLGLITVCSVLVVILCVYCIKRKFADKIEKLLAEEIERSKYSEYPGCSTACGCHVDVCPDRTSSATRYSLTSTVTPGSPSPQTSLFSRLRGKPASGLSPASRSGFEELLRRVARRPAGPREGEEARGDDEKLRILSNLVSSSPRRMSLDEFFRLNEKRLQQESSGEGEQETSLSSKLSPRFCRHSAPSFTDFASIGEQPHREAVSSSSSSASSPSHRVEEQVRAEITPPPPSQSPPPSTHRAPEVKIFKVPSQESDGNIYDSYPDLQPDSNDSMFLRVPNALAPPLRGSLMERSNSLTVPPMFEESASCSIIIQAEHEFHPPVRKYSVDLPMPKILITSNVDDPCTPQTPNPSKHIEYLSPYISNDRTISESNLSTSGYSSLSSPGLSRCNSGSPVTLEEHSKSCPPSAFLFPPTPVACELSPQRTRHLLASKHRRSGHHHHPPIKKTSSYQTTSTEESIEDESLDPAEIRRRQQQGLLVGTRAEVEPFVCYPDKTSPKSKGACRKHAGARRSPTEHLSPDHHKSSESDEDPESSRGGKPRKPRVRSHDSAESVKSPGGSPRPLASPPFPKYRNKPPGSPIPQLASLESSHPSESEEEESSVLRVRGPRQPLLRRQEALVEDDVRYS